jgi:hypothetical protein
MTKKTVKPCAIFTLLSLMLLSMFSIVILPMANAVSPTDDDKAWKKNGPTSAAKGGQGNSCDVSDSACKQANEDQSASWSHNKAIGFNDQSGTTAPSGDKKAASGNFTDILMKIDGVDHSTVKVKVWVATDGYKEMSKIFNPVPLLNPEDDDRGIVLVPMKVEKGLLDIGDTYTGCIKVIEDTDKYGNKQSCQQSVLRLEGDQEAPNSIKPTASDSAPAIVVDDGNGVAVIRISL